MKQLEANINGIKAIINECGNHFIICCHGLYSNKDSMKYVEMAELACKNGLSCVRFDFRGCGESTGKFEEATLSNRLKDLDEVVKYVKKNYNASISLFGSSFGGMVAIAYAYKNKIKPLVIMSTPHKIEGIEKNFVEDARKYDLLEMVKTLSHILIIHGRKDEIVPLSHAEKIYEIAKQPKKILLFEADHSFSSNNERRKALEEAVAWIKKFRF